MVTGAFGEPWTISVGLISMFCPAFAVLESGLLFWPQPAANKAAETDMAATTLRWNLLMT